MPDSRMVIVEVEGRDGILGIYQRKSREDMLMDGMCISVKEKELWMTIRYLVCATLGIYQVENRLPSWEPFTKMGKLGIKQVCGWWCRWKIKNNC